MAYFLKKSNYKRGLYLQIYESFRDIKKQQTAHRSYKTLGYVDDLIASGIEDPISFYKAEVDKLNKVLKEEKRLAKREEIGNDSEINLGHFLINACFNRFNISKELRLIAASSGVSFDVYQLLKGLVIGRVIDPCSKIKTLRDVFPLLYGDYTFNEREMYEGLKFLGAEHEGIVELLNDVYARKFPRKTDKLFYDTTNFYFEIDYEDDLRKKGPSKENRHDPIVGMGLLLDGDQIPFAVSFYPGNQSEKGELPKTIEVIKKRYGVTGKTVQVADKGLNCSKNIVEALKRGDGYLFSQSIKKLPEIEKKWVLNPNDWQDVFDQEGKLSYRYKTCIDDFPYMVEDSNNKKIKVNLEQKRMVTFNPSLANKHRQEINKMISKVRELSARAAFKSEYGDAKKYVDFVSVDGEGVIDEDMSVRAVINQKKLEEDLLLAGYNMLVTSETDMRAFDMYKTYHTLWRIEETFRILKSSLEARPVYVQTKESIYGHFIANYIAVFFLRVLQIKVFEDKIHPNQIIEFCRNFKATKIGKKYLNISNRSKIETIANKVNTDILGRYLNETLITELMKKKI